MTKNNMTQSEVDYQAEKNTLISNIQNMQQMAYGMQANFDYLNQLHPDSLRRIQSACIPEYNLKIIQTRI